MTGITNPTEEYFKDGLWGWDGTQWRKAGMPLWYSGELSENLGGTATGTTYTKYSSTVPAGSVYIVNAISIRNVTRAPGRTQIIVTTAGGILVHLSWINSLVQYQPLIWTGSLVMPPGWRAYVAMADTVSGDEIAGGLTGYEVKIA